MNATRTISISKRLLRNFLLLAGLSVVGLTVLYVYWLWDARDVFADDELGDIATIAVRDARRLADGTVELKHSDRTIRELDDVDGLRIFVMDPRTGRTVKDSPVGTGALLPIAPSTAWRLPYMVVDAPPGAAIGRRYQLALVTRDVRGVGPLRVAVMRPEPRHDDIGHWILTSVFPEVLPVIAPIFVIIMAIALWTVRSALRPVTRAADQANLIDASRPETRLETAVPAEIRPLVDAVNKAFDRLALGFAEQRRFTANAAHELRTPLAVLRARLDALEDRGMADAIRADVERMSRIIDQLLAVSRLDSRLPITKDPVDLAEVASDVVARLAPLAVAAGKQLSLQAPDRPVRVVGNAEMLAAAARNLVENALRYTPRGQSVNVVIEGEADNVRLEVHDAGPGVTADTQQHIFERFWRGHDRGGGAGLGLAIVHEVAVQHGGRVEVARSAMGGALFRLTLPPMDVQAAA
ncbi:MAG: HAMP domain-containing histidine kinase [Alphaproteobacteria bacterium]|nr:HAMP domain-containing histidine kinase [Alphaproteobacteria bacterium]MCW5739033.1 HAMP domain-containing histidine kinase [Alphaproteobacteria bacterium]